MIPIHYVDTNQDQKAKVLVETKKPSGYAPSPEYHPTMVAVKCGECGSLGVVEFVNGFDLAKGDRLMEGKPVAGLCARCNRQTELIPIKHILGEEKNARILHEYRMARAVERLAKNGRTIPDNAIILPVEKQEEYERRIAGV